VTALVFHNLRRMLVVSKALHRFTVQHRDLLRANADANL